MTLSTIYRRSVFFPWMFVLLSVTGYSIIQERNYKSEYGTNGFIVGTAIIVTIVYGLIISLLALSIFLNKHEKISSNNILLILSWFLLPLGFICAVIGKAINEYVTVGSTSEIIYTTILNLPFVIGLIWGFKRFKKLKRHKQI